YGAIDFYKECKDKGVKPIIGVDFFVAPRTRFDKEYRTDDHTYRLVLLAKNEQGYKNLIQLVTLSHLEGFYNRPRIDRELMEKYREGLVAIMSAHGGEHIPAIDDKKRAEEIVVWYKKAYGEDLYIEITRHSEIEGHEPTMKKVIALSKTAGVPLVAAQN